VLEELPQDDMEFSNQSVKNAIEKFVRAVKDMDEKILVPHRLMDLKMGDDSDTVEETKTSWKYPVSANNGKRRKSILKDMATTDLYNIYTMLNSLKNELLWGQNKAPEDDDDRQKYQNPANGSVITSDPSPAVKGHCRFPSTLSMISTNSTASTSASDSETGNDDDSRTQSEDNNGQDVDRSVQVAEHFRRHLHGLHYSLLQMTEAAVYVTQRYENDVGSTV
jgi:hypothetical protein